VPTGNPANLPFQPPSVNLWDYAPEVVQGWQRLGDFTTALQAVILVVLIFVAIMLIRNALNNLQNEGNDVPPSE
jgi:hypothetical protein